MRQAVAQLDDIVQRDRADYAHIAAGVFAPALQQAGAVVQADQLAETKARIAFCSLADLRLAVHQGGAVLDRQLAERLLVDALEDLLQNRARFLDGGIVIALLQKMLDLFQLVALDDCLHRHAPLRAVFCLTVYHINLFFDTIFKKTRLMVY